MATPFRRTVDGLFDGIAAALASVTATDALNFIKHCGYDATRRRNPVYMGVIHRKEIRMIRGLIKLYLAKKAFDLLRRHMHR